MSEKDYSPLFDDWRTLSPEEFIEQLFIKTDTDGILDMAQWHVADMEHFVPAVDRHHMNWSMTKKDWIIRQFCELCDALQKIAPYFDVNATAAPISIKDTRLLEIWDKYLRPLDGGNMDIEELKDIEDRMRTQRAVQHIAADFSKGKELDAHEKGLLIEYMDITITVKERLYLEQYEENIREDAHRRVGGKYYATDLIEQARRTCRDLKRNPPEHVLHDLLIYLAYCMVVNLACDSMESLHNTQYLWDKMLAMEIDEDEDEATATPESDKKTNSSKYLMPVYVLKILKDSTDNKHHMRQTELLEELKDRGIYVERKALNRAVHTLAADPQIPVNQDAKTGVWYVQ